MSVVYLAIDSAADGDPKDVYFLMPVIIIKCDPPEIGPRNEFSVFVPSYKKCLAADGDEVFVWTSEDEGGIGLALPWNGCICGGRPLGDAALAHYGSASRATRLKVRLPGRR
jgi:hypothetical protein